MGPFFYLGIGGEVRYDFESSKAGVPIYLDIRSDISQRAYRPFLDFRIGYSTSSGQQMYLSPSIGFRCPLGSRSALNLQMGYVCQKYEGYVWEDYFHSPKEKTKALEGIQFRLGIEL